MKFIWSERGLAFARLWASPEAVQSQFLAEFEEQGIKLPKLLHTVEAGVDHDKTFVGVPSKREPGSLLVDVATYTEMKIDRGPLAGKIVAVPDVPKEDEE